MSRQVAIAVVAILVGACRAELTPTEIVVTVDTTFGVPCTIDALHVEAVGDGDKVEADVTVGDADLPGSITLTPRGDPHEVTVTVTGMRAGVAFAIARGTASFERDSSRELRFVLDRSCVVDPDSDRPRDPCPAVGVGRFVGVPERQPRRGCGELRYALQATSFVMRDACVMPGTSLPIALDNPNEQEVASPLAPPVPFPFRFYGAPVTALWAGTNGYVGLGNAIPNALFGTTTKPRSLGDPLTFPGRGVLAFWDDLRTGDPSVCFAVSGKFPDRILWITWKEACFAIGDTPCDKADLGRLTFGVAFEETTDRIYLGYLSMVAAASPDRAKASNAVIGVTNAVARGCTKELCSMEGACPDGTPCGYTEYSSGRVVDPFPTALELDPQ